MKTNITREMFNSQAEYEFCKRIYEKNTSIYKNRLEQYGFKGYEKVLDAGCGYGQWSLALSKLNKAVYACDADQNRINFLNNLIEENNISNLRVQQAYIDELPYESESFDAVFCYSVIFLTPWKKSFAELARVLKKGGRIYLNTNGFGWYKFLWYSAHNKTEGYDPQRIAANAWRDTYLYNNNLDLQPPYNIIIEPSELIREAENLGFYNIQWDGEGLLNNTNNKETFFQKEYFGDVGVYEIMGIKA